MNSEIVVNNFATNDWMKYGTHYAVLTSAKLTYKNRTGTFVLSYATPNADTSKAVNKTYPKKSTKNILNRTDNLGTTKITKSNTVTITVPTEFFGIIDVIEANKQVARIIRKEYKKGQKFLVSNSGGNVETPVIIGVMD